MKKHLSLVLCLAFLLCFTACASVAEAASGATCEAQGSSEQETISQTLVASQAQEPAFTDVALSSWYAEAAAYMKAHGLMEGTGNGNFSPNGKLTRATIVTVLYRIAGEPNSTAENSFVDVPAGKWYSKAIEWAQESELVEGYGKNRFGPDDDLTREQMATILWRFAGHPVSDPAGSFADEPAISGWAKEAVGWARANQVMQGIGENRFDPQGTANRAQLAQVLMNSIENGLISVLEPEEPVASEPPQEQEEPALNPTPTLTPSPASVEQTGYTVAVPAEYKAPATRQGTVERLDYATLDYAGSGGAVTKTATVYLPYGYDPEDAATRYDILYLMHGWGGHAGEYFEYGSLKNTFDQMIARGDMKPAIIVSASFYNPNSSTDFGSSVAELRQFHQDFENALMPAVEGKYKTYAASPSDADLKASRDHRAFGGFSLGSVTTWMAFCYDTDYIRYFLPMSGSSWYYGGYGDFQTEKNVDFIENLVQENDLDQRGYFIYHAVGTQDAVKSQTLMQAEEMLSREIFTPEHYVFFQMEGGVHDFNAVQEFCYNALPLFWRDSSAVATPSFTASTPITEVMNDPAFGGFGRLLFPVNSSYYSGSTLGDLRLTWYNYVNADKTVEIVNTLKSRAESGETIFYDIYTDAEKRADPAKADTGLFFFRGNPGEKFAVCSAGGGFAYVGAMHDSFPHALELSKRGYNAFALIYRPGWETAMEDLGRAIAFIEKHAEKLQVAKEGYSLWGGSAGARMAATLGNKEYLRQYAGTEIPQAGAVIMQYTGHSEASRRDAPTYACCGTSDGIASWRAMQSRLDTLTESYGIPTEFHAYEGLPHGFGLGIGTAAQGWIDDAAAFWEAQTAV